MSNIPGRKLIVVDIQPAYENACKYFMNEFVEAINNFEGDILYLYNGPEMGFENENEIQDWLVQYAAEIYGEEIYDEEADEYISNEQLESFRSKVNEIYFIEKGYGFIRDTLDEGYKDETLQIVQYLISNDLNDSSEIDEEQYEEMDLPEELKENLIDEGWKIALPAFNFNILKHWGGSTLVGGGENECLLEVEVLLNAMNIPYTTFNKFIYS